MGQLLVIDVFDRDQTVSQPQCGLHRVGEALFSARFHLQAVNNNADIMLNLLFQRGRFIDLNQLTIDHGAHKTLAGQVFE